MTTSPPEPNQLRPLAENDGHALTQHRDEHRRDQREHAGGQRAERELDAPVAGGRLQVDGELLGVPLPRLQRVWRHGRWWRGGTPQR